MRNLFSFILNVQCGYFPKYIPKRLYIGSIIRSRWISTPICRDIGQDSMGKESDGDVHTNWDQKKEKFDDMNLRENLLRGIYSYG